MSPTNFWDFACVSAVTVGVCWVAVAIVAYWDTKVSTPSDDDLAEMNAELRRRVQAEQEHRKGVERHYEQKIAELLAFAPERRVEPKAEVEQRYGLEPGTLDQPDTTLPEPE